MSHYSVAITKDKLSALIDKALTGEEVVITRHGKPTAVIRAFPQAERPSPAQAMDRLRRLRQAGPIVDISAADLIRKMRDEGY